MKCTHVDAVTLTLRANPQPFYWCKRCGSLNLEQNEFAVPCPATWRTPGLFEELAEKLTASTPRPA